MSTRKRKSRPIPSVRRTALYAVGVVALLCLVGWNTLGPSTAPSREWMKYAMTVIKDERPSPVAAARVYAYVATAYADAFDATNDSYSASEATRLVLAELMPHRSAQTDAFFHDLVGERNGFVEQKALDVAYRLTRRIHEDGSEVVWQGDAPTDPLLWSSNGAPLDPAAGQWKLWLSDGSTITPPVPLAPESIKLEAETRLVRRVAASRTQSQLEAAYFWAGTAGTPTVSGLWIEELHRYQPRLSDIQLARAQRTLTQAMADALIISWRAKYSYWTKRPYQTDPTIPVATTAPETPSYVSELAAVSAAANEILSKLFPELAQRWKHDAAEARSSRIWAGIHYPHDDVSGNDIGKRVGETIIRKLKLEEM